MTELFTAEDLFKIVQILLIDLLLAGDNAIVIGMAARNLPTDLQKKAIFWGTFGAIAIRLVMAFLFVEALDKIPFLHLVGGLLLLWIGMSLLVKEEHKGGHNIEAKYDLKSAITTIVIADGVMGIDNVLGVVAAAEGHLGLVVAGMLVSVPIIVWGSTLFIKVVERYPAVLYFGGGILGWISADMILAEKFLQPTLASYEIPFKILCVVLVFVGSRLMNSYHANKAKAGEQ